MNNTFDDRYTKGKVIIDNNAPGVALVTLWRLADKIANSLPRGLCAAIGNLYSCSQGLSLLIRSLLANPQIHTLVILTLNDLSGSGQALLNLMRSGTIEGENRFGHRRRLVVGYRNAEIDLTIPAEAIDDLRHRLRVVEVHKISELEFTLLQNNRPPSQARNVEPQHFPEEPPVEIEYWPGGQTGHVVTGRTVAEVWVKALSAIMRYGMPNPNANYGTGTRELLTLTSVITDERATQPELPDWMGVNAEHLDTYSRQLITGEPVDGMSYTYGGRMAEGDQITGAVDKLLTDPTQRGAVISLWQPAIDLPSKSPPCLLTVWPRLTATADCWSLYLSVSFRSHDMFKGYPENMLGLRLLQEHLRLQLVARLGQRVVLGPICCTSLSAHIYEQDYAAAQDVIREHGGHGTRPGTDPFGNYVVEGAGENLTLTQLDPATNTPLRSWRGNAGKLMRVIDRENLTSSAGHAAWLGAEIERYSHRESA